MSKSKNDQLVLVDGSGYIFRAYYALPSMFRSDGLPVNAVFGFCNMLLKLIEDIQSESDGKVSIAVIFDAARETFRNEIYENYKANRSEPPDDLKPQFDIIKTVPNFFNLKSIELKGFEADDLIASYAKVAKNLGKKVMIVSSDKDLMQLIQKNVTILDPIKKKEISEENVLEKFGVIPSKVIEVQALAGDSSDNIPGAPGIGPKIAAQLINEYKSVENLLENLDKIKQEKRRTSLIENSDLIKISKKLVTLKDDINLPIPIEELNFIPLEANKLINFLEKMEFNKIKLNVESKFGKKKETISSHEKPDKSDPILVQEKSKIETNKYELITEKNQLKKWCDLVEENGVVAIDCETNSLNAMEASIVGFSMSLGKSKACYVPLDHKNQDINQIKKEDFIELIKPILEDEAILKIGQNIKYDYIILFNLGITILNMDDTMLMSYVLRTGLRGHNLDELAIDFLSHTTIKYSDVTNIEKKKVTFDYVNVHDALRYAAEDADITFRLWEVLKIQLIQNDLLNFYYCVEKPLVEVIANMEINGFKINEDYLKVLSSDFSKKILLIEDKIFQISKEKFNVGSPKQLGEILFSKLGMPYGKKGKSGNFQTDVKILEKLKSEKFNIASLILDWRQFSKLKNTYCEGLLSRQNIQTTRIHTSFGMASTLTGRLSSNDPNLQNIPIKTIEGRQIRKAFISKKENFIISLDYSQIELRILAHVAQVKSLIKAFNNDEDIHNVTAMEVFQVDKDKLTNDLRRKAKTINFGIIYGISPYGLATQLDISNSEAKDYINNYFDKYPGIKEYMENTIEHCRLNGFVVTPFGRRIYIPFINDKVVTRRNFAERSAINAPIQGGAADLIKIVMPKVSDLIKKQKLKSKMLIQVHDELIFEVPKDEVNLIQKEFPEIMIGASENFLKLDVPVKVDIGIGKSWDDAN